MNTRVVVKFRHELSYEDCRTAEEKLFLWMQNSGYREPLMNGSLVFDEIQVSFLWPEDEPLPNRIIHQQFDLRMKIKELFKVE